MVKRLHKLTPVVLAFLLTGCQNQKPAGSPPSSVVTLTPTRTAQLKPASPTGEPTPLPPALTPTAGTTFPAENAWSDRRPFAAGLIDSEQTALKDLPGATVYHLDIRLDESLTLIQGQQQVYYTNQESVPLEAVYFHLFPNLLGGELAVSNLELDGEATAPQYENQKRAMLVPLSAPLLPGESVAITLEFRTTIPVESDRNYSVFSTVDGILAPAHFYPMVAVYNEASWQIEPATTQGDVVFADSSFYLVKVSAPSDVVIVTSGIEIERDESAGTQVVRYAAGPMRDFYLAASQRFRQISRRVGETEIFSYAPAELAAGAELALDTAAAALTHFNTRFGLYPFTELDIVSTPTLALGVEYPGIFANAIRLYDLDESSAGLPNSVLLESVTAHETGHQWFYSVIGNDQLDEPWLDESLTQYATWLYYIDQYGRTNAAGFYQSFLDRWARVESADIPIGLPVAAYENGTYSAIVYGRGPLFLNELAETVGQDRFDAFLRDYYGAYQWQIATTEGFKELLEAQCSCDLTDLFSAWVYSR